MNRDNEVALRPGVVNLLDGRRLEPTEHLSDRWRSLQVSRIAPGASERFVADDCEHAIYVMEGRGRVASSTQDVPIEGGTALTLPKASAATLTAEAELQIFHVMLRTS